MKNRRTQLCVCLRAQSLSHVRFATSWTAVCQAPLSVESSREEYWSGLPFLVIQALFHTRVALDVTRILKAGFLRTKGLSPCVSISLPNPPQKLPWPPAHSSMTPRGSFSSPNTTNSLSLLYLFSFLFGHVPCGISVSWPGIEPAPLAVKAWSLNHRATEEFLLSLTFWPASTVFTPFPIHNPLKEISQSQLPLTAMRLPICLSLLWKTPSAIPSQLRNPVFTSFLASKIFKTTCGSAANQACFILLLGLAHVKTHDSLLSSYLLNMCLWNLGL